MKVARPTYEHPARDQYVVFALQETRFAVPILQVLRITRKLPLTHVPKAPDFLQGVINDHGVVVPVVDLRRRMALLGASQDEDAERIIIIEASPTPEGAPQVVGLLVDAVVGIDRIDDADIRPPPSMVAQVNGVYLTGVARLEDQAVMVMDLDRVLTIDEVAQLSRRQDLDYAG